MKMRFLLISISFLLVLFFFFSKSCKQFRQKVYILSNTFSGDTLEVDRSYNSKHVRDSAGNSIDSKVMRFEITFATPPLNLEVNPAEFKFNKKGWISFEWDDNARAAMQALLSLNTYSYTDGCGNKIPYTAALAVNGINQRSNLEVGELLGYVTYKEMSELILNRWDIENHGYCHEPVGNYNFGNDRYRNIAELDKLIYERCRYLMNGHVVPTNYDGFPTAAKNFGYLFSTSLQTFDNLPPAAIGKPNALVHDFGQAPVFFSSFHRLFNDDWSAFERQIQKAVSLLNEKKGYYFRAGSHSIDTVYFNKILRYIATKSGDQIMVLPTREVMEYRIMKLQPISVVLDGLKAVVEINCSGLNERIRWRDLTFNIRSDGKILDVKPLTGIDNITFNSQSNIINVFKALKQWNQYCD